MSVADELDKLNAMRDDGTISHEQYERAKAKLLDKDGDARDEEEREERRPRRRRRDRDDEDYGEAELSPRARRKNVRDWCMVLHLSLFAGHAVPFGGIIAPIVIWQTKKDEMPELDEHGKNAVNWLLSAIIYALVCIPLCFIVVGFVLLFALAVLHVVFPIIAAVKANEGRVWKYPLAIPFFK